MRAVRQAASGLIYGLVSLLLVIGSLFLALAQSGPQSKSARDLHTLAVIHVDIQTLAGRDGYGNQQRCRRARPRVQHRSPLPRLAAFRRSRLQPPRRPTRRLAARHTDGCGLMSCSRVTRFSG